MTIERRGWQTETMAVIKAIRPSGMHWHIAPENHESSVKNERQIKITL